MYEHVEKIKADLITNNFLQDSSRFETQNKIEDPSVFKFEIF